MHLRLFRLSTSQFLRHEIEASLLPATRMLRDFAAIIKKDSGIISKSLVPATRDGMPACLELLSTTATATAGGRVAQSLESQLHALRTRAIFDPSGVTNDCALLAIAALTPSGNPTSVATASTASRSAAARAAAGGKPRPRGVDRGRCAVPPLPCVLGADPQSSPARQD